MTRGLMQRGALVVFIGAVFAVTAAAQSDQCRGAVSALSRVKEQITPDLSPKDADGRERLKTMLSTLEAASRVCKTLPELWYYRAVIAERLGQKDTYAEKQARELNYQARYNPFSTPEAAKPSPVEQTPGKVGKKWALVVGIDRFRDSQVPELHFAVKDSTDFAHLLTDTQAGRFPADHVKHLVNDQATLQNVREGLGWLRSSVQPEDLVVIYISSHGSPRDMDPNGVSYIIMHDTALDNAAKLYATSLQMIDLVQQLNRDIKARRVVLFLDTCYSGDASADGSKTIRPIFTSAPPAGDSSASTAFSAAFQNLKIGVGRAVITASRANERSWESTKLKNGYFTHYLVEELRQGQGNRTLGEIFPKVRDEVLAGVRQQYGQTQTPSSEFSERAASIVIGVPEGQ